MNFQALKPEDKILSECSPLREGLQINICGGDNPARYLPYSPMPVNIPYEPTPPNFGGIDQSLCPGTSIEQLDALVDLLSNFDHYAIEHQSVRQQLDATAK